MSERTLKRTGPGAGPQTEPEPEEIDAGGGSRGKLLIVLVAAGVLLVGAGAVLFITRGGDEAAPSGPTATATGTPTAPAGPTASATSATSTTAGRNPFATPDAVTTSSSSSATDSSSSSSTTGSNGTAGTVYVAVFEVASDGSAKFGVNGAEFTAEPGESFGDDVKLTYHKTSRVGTQTCAVLSREDTTFTACPGEMHAVD
jgi:hypothetical protein